eukprot:1142642-Pelagomonas_calceolata.AAC.11
MGPIGGGQGGLENLETPLSKFCQTFGQDFKGCVEAILQQTIPNFQDSDDVQCIITWCRRAVCGLASQLLVPGRAGGWGIQRRAEWYPYHLCRSTGSFWEGQGGAVTWSKTSSGIIWPDLGESVHGDNLQLLPDLLGIWAKDALSWAVLDVQSLL